MEGSGAPLQWFRRIRHEPFFPQLTDLCPTPAVSRPDLWVKIRACVGIGEPSPEERDEAERTFQMNRPITSPRIILVTRGARPVGQAAEPLSIGQTPLIGLGRIIFKGPPSIRCQMVDLDHAGSPDEIRSLFAELWTQEPEEEIALRDGGRFVPRVERATARKIPVEGARSVDGDNTPLDRQVFETYFSYFIRRGFLDPPPPDEYPHPTRIRPSPQNQEEK